MSTRDGHIISMGETGVSVRSPHLGEDLWALAWNPWRQEVLVASRGSADLWRLDDKSLEIRSIDRPIEDGAPTRLVSMAVQPGGALVAGGSMSGAVVLLDADTLKRLSIHRSENDWPHQVVWAPDGQHFAVGTIRGVLRVYDASGVLVMSLPMSSRRISGIAFSADSSQLLVSTADGGIWRIWLRFLHEEVQVQLAEAQQRTGMYLTGAAPVFEEAGAPR